MPEPHEIPQIATELVDMSREYLRQETIEPAKKLGKVAGMGVGGAMVLGLGAFIFSWGVYYGFVSLFENLVSESRWWVVLSRFLTALIAAGLAALIVSRMQSDDYKG